MSRAVLIQCPDCKGKGKFFGVAPLELGDRKCETCKGSGAVPAPPPPVIGLPGKRKVPVNRTCAKGHELPREDGEICQRCLSEARIAHKEAATNYAATLLMSHANADIVLKALSNLEEAALHFAKIKEGR